LSPTNIERPSPVLALSIPHDIDDDVSIRYVQGFLASSLTLEPRNDNNSIPILIYVWPGGVIDVYSCGLLHHVHNSTEEQLHQELITNGSADALRDLLTTSDEDEHSDWMAAKEEIRQLNDMIPIGIRDILSDHLNCFRSLLLRFTR
jgi:hypothetical protein